MKNQSRRNFCKRCLAAGAGIATSVTLTMPSSTILATTTPADDKQANKAPDYSQIGYCGYRCDICPGRSADNALRRKMVAGWKKLYGHTMYTEENVPIVKPCAGCKGSGEIADVQCPVRPCAHEKGVLLCADCAQFPCQQLQSLMADRNQLIMICRNKDITMEEYQLSALQFESLPVLIKRMVEIGKLPVWVKDFII